MRAVPAPVKVRCADPVPRCPWCKSRRRAWLDPFSDIPGLWCEHCKSFERKELEPLPMPRCHCGAPKEYHRMFPGELVCVECQDAGVIA